MGGWTNVSERNIQSLKERVKELEFEVKERTTAKEDLEAKLASCTTTSASRLRQEEEQKEQMILLQKAVSDLKIQVESLKRQLGDRDSTISKMR